MRSVPSTQSGYTLVEMLVVLALVAIIATLASGGMQFSGRVQRASAEHVQTMRDEVEAQRAVRRLFGDAVEPAAEDQAKSPRSGQSNAVKFLADLRGSAGFNGVRAVTLELVREGGHSHLRVAVASDRGPAQSETFGPFPADLTFAFGTITEAGEAVWQDAWDGAGATPKLLRIAAASPNERWAEFHALRHNNEPPGCRYDPVARGCR